jgi:hypothetical protein
LGHGEWRWIWARRGATMEDGSGMPGIRMPIGYGQ